MSLPVNQVPQGAPTRGRAAAVMVLLVLAGLVAGVANVAVWARDTALDTDTYVDTVVPLAGDEELADAVATYLAEQLFAVADLEALAGELLPSGLGGLAELAGSAEAALEPLVRELIVDVLQSDAVGDVWEMLNREGHELLVEVLRGDNQYIRIDGDDIVVDLAPVLDALADRLGAVGAQVAAVVPDEALEFVVYQSPDVGDTVRAIDTLEALARRLPVAALVLFAGAVALSRRRLRTLGLVGASLAGAWLVVLAVESLARGLVLDRVTEPIAQLAGQSLWDAASGRLVGQTFLLVIIGGIVAAFGLGLDFARRNLRA